MRTSHSVPRPARTRPAAQALRLSPLALAVGAYIALLPAAQAQNAVLPVGPAVVQGLASVVVNGNTMTVTNSQNALLNWQSFSIGANGRVNFVQPSATSQVLNRVTGPDASSILGSLQSNGRVWLLNPNGVLFGQSARIDVAGLVASTLVVSDADWQAGRWHFKADASGAPLAQVDNQGELRTPLGGRIALLSGPGGVRNAGLMDAPGGQVVMAAGASVDLVDTGAPNITLRVPVPQGEVLNLGRVLAPGGRVDVQSAIVNQQGLMRADALTTGPGGELVLRATDTLTLAAGSVTAAEGDAGGRIHLDAGNGTAMVEGQVLARGALGRGGQIDALGRQVGLAGEAALKADGAAGGGSVFIGGSAQGKDPAVPSAQATYIGPHTSVSADSTGLGDGGQIIVWSDDTTRAYGSFSARGGPLGGDGGLIETSGGWLDARPLRADASAPLGQPGAWLLDPYNLTIRSGEGGATNVSPTFEATGSPAFVYADDIRAALNYGTSVTVSTSGPAGAAGTEAGTITVSGVDLTGFSLNGDVTLALHAAGSVDIHNSRIGTLAPGSAFNLDVRADSVLGANVDPLTVGIRLTGGSQLWAGGGNGSGSGRVSLSARNVILDNARVESAGPVAIQANSLRFNSGSEVRSNAAGDAIVVSGWEPAGLAQFVNNNAGTPTLSTPTPNARWLIYATSPDPATGVYVDAPYAYTQYGAAYANRVLLNGITATAEAGPGLLYSASTAAQVLLSGGPTKVYDGSAAGTVAGNSLGVAGGLLGSERVVFEPLVQGSYDSRNVGEQGFRMAPGMARVVDGEGRPVYGYDNKLGLLSGLITPATLTYTADPAQWTLPATTPPLTGGVSGFVGDDSLDDATSGSVLFTAPAAALSTPGTYAIQGAGLTATNYVFVQAAGNGSALTVLPAPQPALLTGDVDAVQAPQTVALVAPLITAERGGMALDLLQGARGAGNTVDGGGTIGAVPVARMSQASLQSMLSAMGLHKEKVLAGGIQQLALNPTLANAPDCINPRQLDTGQCFITEAIKLDGAVRAVVSVAAGADKAPEPATASASATSAPAAGVSSAPARAEPTAASGPGAEPTALQAQAAPSDKRRVMSAALPQIERKVALLIGINDYADTRIPALSNAVGDAASVGQVLAQRLGYETVVLPNASKAQIIRALNALATTLGPKDSVVIYYAGHGQLVSATGLGYWLPSNADASKPETWVSNSDISKFVGILGASQVAVVADSCFSGSLVTGPRIAPAAADADPNALLRQRAVVVMSSGGNEPVFDSGKNGHSTFASGLMQSLQRVSTWQAGSNLFERVRFAVARELPQRPQYGAAVQAGHVAGSDYVFESRQLAAQ